MSLGNLGKLAETWIVSLPGYSDAPIALEVFDRVSVFADEERAFNRHCLPREPTYPRGEFADSRSRNGRTCWQDGSQTQIAKERQPHLPSVNAKANVCNGWKADIITAAARTY